MNPFSNVEWKTVPLREVIDLIKEQINPQDEPEIEYNYLSIGNVQSNTGRLVDFTPTRGIEIKSTKLVFTTLDVLYSRLRPNLNKVHIPKFDGICATDMLPLRPKSSIDREFLAYYLRTPQVVEYATSRTQGIQLPRLSTKDLLRLPVPIPPIEVQKKIASLVGGVSDRTLVTQEELSRIPALTRRLRMAILSKAFRGEITSGNPNDTPVEQLLENINKNDSVRKLYEECGKKWTSSGLRKKPIEELTTEELPVGWKYVELGRWIYIAARIGWRGLKAKEYTNEGPLFLSVSNLNKGDIVDLTECCHISYERYIESPEIQLKNDDILLSKDGSIGKVGIIKNLTEKATVNSSLLVIRGGELFHPEYLLYLLKGPEMQRVVNERTMGTAVPHLFQRDIKNFILPVAPKDEQKRIADAIGLNFARIEHIETSTREVERKLEALNKSILNRSFSGGLFSNFHPDPNIRELSKNIEENAKKSKNRPAEQSLLTDYDNE